MSIGDWSLQWIGVDSSGNDLYVFMPASGGLSAVTLNPGTVTGGTPSTGTITLTDAAPAGGVTVSLTGDTIVLSGWSITT